MKTCFVPVCSRIDAIDGKTRVLDFHFMNCFSATAENIIDNFGVALDNSIRSINDAFVEVKTTLNSAFAIFDNE